MDTYETFTAPAEGNASSSHASHVAVQEVDGGGRGEGDARIPEMSLVRLSQRHAVNVGVPERVASGVLGLLSLRAGLRPGGVVGSSGLLGVGAWLLGRGITGRCPLYSRLGVALDPAEASGWQSAPLRLGASILIRSERSTVYACWRDPERLAQAFSGLEAAGTPAESVSLWSLRLPCGMERSWTARVAEERPDELIAWETVEPSDVQHSGSVRFFARDEGRETFVQVEGVWFAPLGALGIGARAALRSALRRMKALLEAGEVPVARAVSARRSKGAKRESCSDRAAVQAGGETARGDEELQPFGPPQSRRSRRLEPLEHVSPEGAQ